MKFRTLHFYTITWKNHKNCSHTNKNSSRYFSCHTMVWGESYLCHILITRICGGSHSYVCYYCLSLLREAVFIIVPIYCSIQFTFKMPICFCWRFVAIEEFLADMKQNIVTCTICNMQHLQHATLSVCCLVGNSYIYIILFII